MTTPTPTPAETFLASTDLAVPSPEWLAWYPRLAAKWDVCEPLHPYAPGNPASEVVCRASDGSTMAINVRHLRPFAVAGVRTLADLRARRDQEARAYQTLRTYVRGTARANGETVKAACARIALAVDEVSGGARAVFDAFPDIATMPDPDAYVLASLDCILGFDEGHDDYHDRRAGYPR